MFGVVTLHFVYMYNVATLSVDVTTIVACCNRDSEFCYLDHVMTLSVNVATFL